MNDYIRAEEIKKSFHQKFTQDDFEFEKEREIIEIKNKVLQNCKNGNRTAQLIQGFIHPDDISIIDYKFSLATNKQDEEAITAGSTQDENDKSFKELAEYSDSDTKGNRCGLADGLDISQFVIISHEGMFSMTWTFFDIICCLASSYVYIWLATFGDAPYLQHMNKDIKTSKEVEDLQSPLIMQISLIFELVFAFSILTRFLTDYTPDGETEAVKSLPKISTRYLHTDFFWDLLPLIPLPQFFQTVAPRHAKLLYMIKCIRIINGFKLFNVSLMLVSIKKFSQKRMRDLIKTNPELAEDMDQDNNQIEFLMMVNYGLKTFKLIILIINISFFLGMFWLIFCDVTKEITENYQKNVITEFATEKHIAQTNQKKCLTEIIPQLIKKQEAAAKLKQD